MKNSESTTLSATSPKKAGVTRMDYVQTVDDRRFNDVISHGMVLVDFSADWCGPCRMLAPILDMLAKELEGRVTVVKVDVDESQSIATQYDISSVPTLLLFKDGELKHRMVGLKDFATLKSLIEEIEG
jgi:thioredoxin 1